MTNIKSIISLLVATLFLTGCYTQLNTVAQPNTTSSNSSVEKNELYQYYGDLDVAEIRYVYELRTHGLISKYEYYNRLNRLQYSTRFYTVGPSYYGYIDFYDPLYEPYISRSLFRFKLYNYYYSGFRYYRQGFHAGFHFGYNYGYQYRYYNHYPNYYSNYYERNDYNYKPRRSTIGRADVRNRRSGRSATSRSGVRSSRTENTRRSYERGESSNRRGRVGRSYNIDRYDIINRINNREISRRLNQNTRQLERRRTEIMKDRRQRMRQRRIQIRQRNREIRSRSNIRSRRIERNRSSKRSRVKSRNVKRSRTERGNSNRSSRERGSSRSSSNRGGNNNN